MKHSCDDRELEAILNLDGGGQLSSDLGASCARCEHRRRLHRRIGQMLLQPPHYAAPAPPDWKGRVLTAIDADHSRTRRQTTWWVPIGLLASAAAVWIASLVTRRHDPQAEARRPTTVALAVQPDRLQRLRGPGAEGALSAAVGDRLTARAEISGHGAAEFWVFRAQQPIVVRCREQAPCRLGPRDISLELELGGVGDYQVILVLSPPRVEGEIGTYAAAIASLRRAGAVIEVAPLVRVW